jgi:hypothetical protein
MIIITRKKKDINNKSFKRIPIKTFSEYEHIHYLKSTPLRYRH